MSYGYPKTARLRHRYQYRRFGRDSLKRAGQLIVVEQRQGRADTPKLGITVTRKYGKSHERNRFKRLVREAYRLNSSQFPAGIEIHIRPKHSARHARMQDIQAELLALVGAG